MAYMALAMIFLLLDCAALLFMALFYVVNLSDLECDYVNASSCCHKISKVVYPEVVAASLITVVLLLTGHYGSLAVNLPMVAWLIYRIVNKPPGNISFYDPAEIHNRQQLKGYVQESIVKLCYHMLCFFFYLYIMILALVGEEGFEDTNSSPMHMPYDMMK